MSERGPRGSLNVPAGRPLLPTSRSGARPQRKSQGAGDVKSLSCHGGGASVKKQRFIGLARDILETIVPLRRRPPFIRRFDVA